MKVIDVFQQDFAAACVYGGVARRAARVTLTATSEEGTIRYEAGVTFFPHRDAEDFAISCDAYAAKEVYLAKGRRSKKREETMLAELREHADEAAATLGGTIDWEKPLGEARRG